MTTTDATAARPSNPGYNSLVFLKEDRANSAPPEFGPYPTTMPNPHSPVTLLSPNCVHRIQEASREIHCFTSVYFDAENPPTQQIPNQYSVTVISSRGVENTFEKKELRAPLVEGKNKYTLGGNVVELKFTAQVFAKTTEGATVRTDVESSMPITPDLRAVRVRYLVSAGEKPLFFAPDMSCIGSDRREIRSTYSITYYTQGPDETQFSLLEGPYMCKNPRDNDSTLEFFDPPGIFN